MNPEIPPVAPHTENPTVNLNVSPAKCSEPSQTQVESVLPCHAPATGGPLAWVLSDKSGIRQTILQARGFTTTSFHHDLHSKRHLESMLRTLQHQKPAVLWLRLAGPASGSGNRTDSRRTDNLVRLARVQADAGRSLVVEANTKSGAWHMNAIMELCQKLHTSRHAWCRHEVLTHSDSLPCNSELMVCTNFPMPDYSQCRCPNGTRHVSSKSLSADLRIRTVLESLVDIALREGCAVLRNYQYNGPLHGQPESPINMQSQDCSTLSLGTKSSMEIGLGFTATRAGHSSSRFDPSSHDGEALAKLALEDQNFSFEVCLKVLEGMRFQPQYKNRQVQSIDAPSQGCYVFGAYSYGAFYGVTRNLLNLPCAVRYINAFLRAQGALMPWSSFSINHNTVLKPHKDHNNQSDSHNQSIALGPFQGGELWVAVSEFNDGSGLSHHELSENSAVKVLPNGSRAKGHVISSRHRLITFPPGVLHATMPWSGVRWSITTYVNRGLQHLTNSHLRQLRTLGFNLPSSSQFTFECQQQTSLEDIAPSDMLDPILALEKVSFPTAQAMNRKAKLKAGHVVQPKHKLVEQWRDDMGEDLSSLSAVLAGVAWTPFLLGSVAEDTPLTPVQQANEDFVYDYLCQTERWLHGTGVLDLTCQVLQPSALLAFVVNRRTWLPAVSVCELFGGEGRTSFLVAKLHDLATGVNFDLTSGFDLLDAQHVQLLWQYVRVMQPSVIVMAPPCTAFCRLQGLNRMLHPAAWQRAQTVGVPLARLCAELALFQLKQSRHFLLEQPHGSLLFQLPEFVALARLYSLARVVFDQCMTGLRLMTFPFLLIRKRTQMWASAPIILARLSAYQCDGKHSHASVSTVSSSHREPHVSSRESQVWPYKLCKIIAAGIADLVCQNLSTSQHYFPVDCPGCRGHLRRDDPKHSRTGDCKYPSVEPTIWTCKACKLGRPRADKNHTLDHTCRWAVARSMPEGASRERSGGHPRDPRVPACRDPTADVRLDGPDPVIARGAASGSGIRRDAEGRELPDAPAPAFRRHAASASGSGVRNRHDAATQAEAAVDLPNLASVGEAVPAAPADPADAPPADAPAGAPEAEAEERAWNRFDLGRALQQLRSVREGVVLRALRQLHIRWYHCSAHKMKDLLQAAGVSPDVLNLVARVVDTCSICRAWSRPGPRSVATTSLPTRFNEVVEADLLFYKQHVILHLLDRCTRFTVTSLLPNREVDSILEHLHRFWIALLGPPGTLVSDQEGAFQSPISATFLERKGIDLKLRAKEQHAQTVERHHEILRQQLHKLEEQCTSDGIRASFQMILAEATYAKNALFRCGHHTPYEAVFGRTPSLLAPLQYESGADISERDCEKLRHAAIESMIQASAHDRVVRASASRTRPAGELLGIEVGELVEFFRKPSTKDTSGWHGPATVVDTTSMRDGQLGLRWQGRLITCRLQDVRRALTYTCLLMVPQANSPTTMVQQAAELLMGTIVRLGWFRSGDRWLAFEANVRYPRELLAGLHLASCLLHLTGVVSFRMGCDVLSLPAVSCDDTLLIWWPVGVLEEWCHVFLPGHQPVNFSRLCPNVKAKVAFVQFFCENAETVASVRQVVDDIPNLGGPYDPQMPPTHDVTHRVRLEAGTPALALEDVPRQRPQHFDISTPPNSSSQVPSQADVDSEDDIHVESTESMFMHYATHPPQVTVDSAPEIAFVFDSAELDAELPSLEIAPPLVVYLVTPRLTNRPRDDEVVVLHYNVDGVEAVIERVNNVLTRQEALQHTEECRTAMVAELMRWHKHSAWYRGPRDKADNILTSKWVLKWKNMGGQRKIKGRMVAQGFKDKQTDVKTYAATSTRWSQRLLVVMATQQGWTLLSADISEAFLRGLTYDELLESGEHKTKRSVQLSIPPGTSELLRSLPGMSDFCEQSEVLYLRKPGFGLRDAPRLWSLALQRVLHALGLTACQGDSQLFIKHKDSRLVLALSIHIDDLKITGIPSEQQILVKALEEKFDAMKIEQDNFEHLGVMHRLHDDGSRTLSQENYVKELRPIPEAELKLMPSEDAVNDQINSQYMSLLGGLAWVVQTRPDIAVFISALQRRLQKPRVQDVLNLNRVLKYVKLKPIVLTFKPVKRPWSLVAISDSAYKGEDQDCLAVRSGLIALVDKEGIKEGINNLQLLEFVSKKQTRVCRSTFAAELHSCLDLFGLAVVINATLTELLNGPQTSAQLAKALDDGSNALLLDMVIDHRGLLDAAASDENKSTDSAVLLHLMKLREDLKNRIRTLYWVDTRSMVADALNKGAIDRCQLHELCSEGTWTISQALVSHHSVSKGRS